MDKGRTCAAALWLAVVAGRIGTAGLVNPGDLAFVGYNADGRDDLALVLLAPAEAGTVVRLTDREWQGTAFNSGEGAVTWTVTQNLNAGTVVVLSNLDSIGNPGFGASSGQLSGSLQLAAGGETVYAFLGPTATTPTTFLAAISTLESDFQGSTGTLNGTGLVQGATAVLLPAGTRGAQYVGSRSSQGHFSDYLQRIGNTADQWSVDTVNGSNVLPLDATVFATPEPATWLLTALAGLGAAGAVRRQSRRRR